MKRHLDQAAHNQDFHDSIESSFSENYYDWKITVLFYVSIHYLKALAKKRKCDIGDTHHEIEQNVNPLRDNAIMRIKTGAWNDYKALYRYSRTSRYEGIADCDTFEQIQKRDHSMCLIHLGNFKKYIISQSIEI